MLIAQNFSKIEFKKAPTQTLLEMLEECRIEAVSKEKFEMAAVLRDTIKQLNEDKK